jgi:RimJ/RimL family protein N-acetyltransferase
MNTELTTIDSDTYCRIINGKVLNLRPVRMTDTQRTVEFLNGLSYGTRYLRFGSGSPAFTTEQAASLCHPTPLEWRRFAVVMDHAGCEIQIASASYYIQENLENCDLTILVADEWHGSQLADWLLTSVLDDARRCGLREVHAHILGTNRRMIRLAQRHGFAESPETSQAPIKLLILAFDKADAVGETRQ